MSGVLDLVRPEIRALDPYRAADYAEGLVRLNANENPWAPVAGDAPFNRYPEVRPIALTRALAAHYGVAETQLLVTRGSSEAIDLLVRCCCAAGRDGIVVGPPTFGMYAVYARIQGAAVVPVPLRAAEGFALDVEAIDAACDGRVKLVFVCSPNNPTGNAVPTATLVELADRLAGRALVVVDAAYVEFAAEDPTQALLERCPNVVLLRTLSKALGLAAVRCGALLGPSELVATLAPVLPPYCMPLPTQQAVLANLAPAALAIQREQRRILTAERRRVAARLAAAPGIRRVWPSEANFLFVEAADPAAAVAAARAGGVLIRDFSRDPAAPGGLRITIGTPAENERLLAALEGGA